MLRELKAVYSNQKVFYGKACVHQVNSYIIDLYSYDTRVCTVNRATRTITLREQWDRSNTTLRYVREFLAQCCNERFAHASKKGVQRGAPFRPGNTRVADRARIAL